MRFLNRVLLMTIFFCVVVLLTCWRFHLRVNFSGSMPYGVYRMKDVGTVARGDLVDVCLRDELSLHALERHYVSTGDCPNGTQSLLKQVIALPSDDVRFRHDDVIVNGRSYFSARLTRDHSDQPIRIFSSPNFFHGYWLRGYRDPNRSWDSRYFGAVSRNEIRAIYEPVMIF